LSEESMYEKLERAWLRERASDELQPLDPNFFREMRDWIDRLRKEALESNEITRTILEKQAEICDALLSSLLKMRAVKVAALLVSGERLEGIDEELKFLKSALGMEEIEEKVKIVGKKEVRGAPLVLVTFKSQVPAFVGVDLAVYGPFSEGDVAHIPEENARILARRGLVEVLSEDESSKRD